MDNITAPATGVVLATDDIGGVQHPRSKVGFGADGAYVDVSEDAPLPVALSGSLPVTGTFWPATQPVSGTVGVSGSVAVTGTFWPETQPVSAESLPLPSGAATSANQDAEIAALATVGTRAYAAGVTALAVGSANSASTAITANEVLLHASSKMYVRAGAPATVNDIPLEAGEKFHMRLASGQTINAIRDSADGTLNIVPVA